MRSSSSARTSSTRVKRWTAAAASPEVEHPTPPVVFTRSTHGAIPAGGYMLSRRSRVERTGLGDHARATPTPKPNGDESSRVESSTTAHPPASRSATMSVAPRGARDHERMRGVESRARRE